MTIRECWGQPLPVNGRGSQSHGPRRGVGSRGDSDHVINSDSKSSDTRTTKGLTITGESLDEIFGRVGGHITRRVPME